MAAVNYRHAYHAGNVGDCLKHVVLIWLIRAMQRKPAPLFVLDTHAGAGRYRLDEAPAMRTGEWQHGIGRLLDDPPQVLADFVQLVQAVGLYPGSPVITRTLMRPRDRMACCERHPEDAAALRKLFQDDRQIGVHFRDGWEALGALLPPQEKRGLVLIDPPFEDPQEFGAMAEGLAIGWRRFRTGVFAAWYPIKQRAPVRQLATDVRDGGIRDVVTVELVLREPVDPGRLNGCGMLLINPPYRFEDELRPILAALLDRLGNREPGEAAEVTRIADE
jgi:23S rRNA (adenine2030-N6)-methyltransferase